MTPPDLIVTLDPDGRHDARQITDLVRMFLARRSGLTIGSRWVRGGSSPGTGGPRALASRRPARSCAGPPGCAGSTTPRRRSGWSSPDVVRTVLDDGLRASTGYGFYPAFVALAQAYGFSVDEVPIVFRPRYSDVATLSLRDVGDFQSQPRPASGPRTSEVRAKMRADQADVGVAVGTDARPGGRPVGSSFGADVELERLAAADRFIGWIADEIAPHLGRRVPRGRRRHRHRVDGAAGRRRPTSS